MSRTLLMITASARQTRSITRDLASAFLDNWQTRMHASTVLHRDVGASPPTIISERWISAAFTPEAQRTLEQSRLLAESDTLIDELARADVVVIATPMYNYGMPAALKARGDQVVRIGRTFDFDLARGDFPLHATMGGKVLVALTSSGEFGFGPGGVREAENHLLPHLRTVSKYLGTAQLHHVGVEFQEFGDKRHEQSKATAFAAMPELANLIADRLQLPRSVQV